MKTMFLSLLLLGCATSYNHFQSASICIDKPTRFYHDKNTGICWFMMGKQIITAPCEKLAKITYCPQTRLKPEPSPEPTPSPKPDAAKKKKAPPKK